MKSWQCTSQEGCGIRYKIRAIAPSLQPYYPQVGHQNDESRGSSYTTYLFRRARAESGYPICQLCRVLGLFLKDFNKPSWFLSLRA